MSAPTVPDTDRVELGAEETGLPVPRLAGAPPRLRRIQVPIGRSSSSTGSSRPVT